MSSRVAATRCAVLLGALGLVLASGSNGAAQVYAGKQIRMVVASGAGGGYDLYARTLTRHMARHIPGNPTFINQNMPGAAGMQATNWAYTIAPKDGTVIVATYNAL